MEIIDFLANDNYIIVNKDLIRKIGLNEAVLIGELASEYKSWRKKEKLVDDMFYSTIENIEVNTGLNEYHQRKIINNLIKLDLIECKVKGMPATRYIKLKQENIAKMLNLQFFNNLSSSSLKFKELVPENLKGNSNKNNNKNNNIIIDTIYDYLEQNGFALTPIQYEVVSQWEDNELTRHAIKQAVLNNKFNINYIDKIIYSYKKNNITTVQQAIDQEEEFNKKRDLYYQKKYEVKESRYERERRLLQIDDED